MICIEIENGYNVIRKKKNRVIASLVKLIGKPNKIVEKKIAESIIDNLKKENIEAKVWIEK